MNQNSNLQEEARVAREASKKLKRRMLIIVGAMVAFIIVAVPLINLLEGIENDRKNNVETVKRPLQDPYPPDYDANILKDPDYLELDRDFYLQDGNVTTVMDTNNLQKYDPAVLLLYKMVNAIIKGDADTYNDCFADVYYNSIGVNGTQNEPELPFTMQRVYDIRITKVRVESKTEDGKKYTEYLYGLEYKINRNDATFRTDIDHDASRIQYFRITDRESADVKIEFWRYE